jgi:hypothetical protein
LLKTQTVNITIMKKLNFEDFIENQLLRNQKATIIGGSTPTGPGTPTGPALPSAPEPEPAGGYNPDIKEDDLTTPPMTFTPEAP